MGCPAKKVVGGQCGSALMREPALAEALVAAVVAAVKVPVTVKMRLGWDHDDRNAPAFARRLEGAGAKAFTVHGRTRAQFYEGNADWQFIGEVKDAVRVPVLANGDVRTIEDARQILKVSGADGLLVGRGAFGRPWLVAQMQAAVRSATAPADPNDSEKWAVALTQYQHSVAHYGGDLGRRVVRKHLGWYAQSIGGDKMLRERLVRAADPEPLLVALAAGDLAAAA
jgi:tRNA-dihydrouridine synthase B